MRIRIKLRIGLGCAAIVALLVVGAVTVAVMDLQQGIERMRNTDAVVKAIFELQILATDYLNRPSERSQEQWERRYASLLDRLAVLEAQTPRQRSIVQRLYENHAALGRAFTEMARIPQSTQLTPEQRSQLRTHLATKLDTGMLALITNANHLSGAIHGDLERGQRREAVVLVVSLLVLVGLLLALVAMINHTAIRPLSALQKDAEIIGQGDLDHHTDIRSQDEIGELANALDRMVDQLRSVMARRDELDAEVEMRKQLEHKLRGVLGKLRQSNEDLEQFAYSASHDLQEPLRKVVAFGSLLEKEHGDKLPEEAHQYVEIMVGAAQRMQNLINALLGYSRVTTRGKAFESVDLNRVAEGVLSDLELRIKETDAAVTVASLPTIEADATQMGQLLQNLVSNALKFHAENRPIEVRVSAETAADGSTCTLCVEDNGIGFDPAHTDRIFRVFQRLHGRQEYAGSGIGLAVCRRICERHGGTIHATSTLGEGATFSVALPVRHEKEEGKNTS